MEQIEFIIVDNASTDNTLVILDRWQKTMGDRLTVVVNEKNLGFSGGNNEGAMHTNEITKLLVFVSNDVIPFGDYITPLLKILKPRILYGAELLAHNTGWNTFQGIIIPYLTGWCVAAEHNTWFKYLEWDERYWPCDYEDIDLSCTATQNGVKLQEVHLPLQHQSGQSAMGIAGGRLPVTQNSRELFINKWGLD